MMKLLCLYQVMFQYRVGTYEAMSKLPGVDFELWHGKDVPNSKLKNYRGTVAFRRRVLPTVRFSGKTNNGGISIAYHPFLFFKLIGHNPEVILTEGASSILTSTVAFLYCKLFRKKIIWWSLGTLTGHTTKGLSSIVHRWAEYMERNSHAIFAYSSQAENYFVSIGVKPERIFKAINVINSESKFKSIEDAGVIVKEEGFNVAFVGAIAQTKRLEMLVDAVSDLSKNISDIKLHIIGDGGYLETLKEYVSKSACSQNIVFHGRVVDDLNVLLKRYTVLVLPGLGGLAIVDGMVSALPIIAGRADGTELDLIENGVNGFVTDTMTKEYLVEKLLYLCQNPEEVNRMGKESYSRITGPFSFEHYMSIFSDCLKYVMS